MAGKGQQELKKRKHQEEWKKQFKLKQKELREAVRLEISGMQQIEDGQLQEIIDRHILEKADTEYLPLKERLTLRNNLFNSFRKLDILQQLMDNPDVTEVMINGPWKFPNGHNWAIQ